MEENIRKAIPYFLFGISFIFFTILLRATQLQIIDHDHYHELAQENFWKSESILPKRGTIYDRNGIVLAQDIPSYQISIRLSDFFYDMDTSNDTNHSKNPNLYRARKEPREIEFNIDMNSPYMESFKKLYALLRENNYQVEYPQEIEVENPQGIKQTITTFTLDLITEEYLLKTLKKTFDKKVKQVATKLDDIANKYKKDSKKYRKEKKNIEYDYYRRPEKFLDNIPTNIALKILAREKIFDLEKLNNIEENTKSKKQSLTQNDYKGFLIERSSIREYPQGECAAQLIGSLRRPTEQEIKDAWDDINVKGSLGLEGLFDDLLQGKSGTQGIGKNNTCYRTSEKDGYNIYTTIDIKLQKIAEEALDEQRKKSYAKFQETKNGKIAGGPAIGGAAVLIHIPTGEIRVMASSPRYDNNRYKKIYTSLVQDESHPLLNRCIQYYDAVPPGSTFKVATASYGLAHKIISPYTQFECHKALYPGRKGFRCTHNHGILDVQKAIAGSCNIFFYKVGEMMSFGQLYECAYDFGFGEESGLQLAGEHKGQLPKMDPSWEKGQRRYMGMGQLWATTPIQVARLMYIVATNGIYPNLTLKAYQDKPVQLKLEDEEKYQNGQLKEKPKTHEEIVAYLNNPDREQSNQITCMQRKLNYPPEIWKYIHKGMREVLTWYESTDRYGSARKIEESLGSTVKIAAKTGTAQVEKWVDASGSIQRYNKEKAKNGEIFKKTLDHAWFAGYAPYDNPQYAFAVLIELGGSGGTYAGPVIDKIFKAIYGN